VERTGRSALIRSIVALMRMRGPSTGDVPRWADHPHRVLFLRHDRIGDMIISTGLLDAIGATPGLVLDVLASPENAPVLRHADRIHEVIVFDRWKPLTYPSMIRRLRSGRYDAVIDCMPNAPSLTTLLLMLASGARHRIGVSGRGLESVLTIPAAPIPGTVHIIEHLAALAVPFGVDAATTDWRPRIPLTDQEKSLAEERWHAASDGSAGRRLLVNVSAGKDFRFWPDERFIHAIDGVHRRDATIAVIIIGSPSDADRVRRIAAGSSATPVRTPGIRDALALVATADFVLTPDTSIGHAAEAFRRPAVVMFSHGYVERWGLYKTPGHSIASPRRELESLPAEPVLAALADLMHFSE